MNEEKDATPEVVDTEATETDAVATAAEDAAEPVQAAEADGPEENEEDETTELSSGDATETEIEEDDEGVQVVRTSDYDSKRAFAEFPLSAEVLQGIEAHGYTSATAVQAATLDAALAGRDMVVRSKPVPERPLLSVCRSSSGYLPVNAR